MAQPAPTGGAAIPGTTTALASRPGGEHPYARVNEKNPKEYFDYDSAVVDWGSVEPYIAHKKIGQGKFSEVFLGMNALNGEPCVLKALKPVREKKILREVTLLKHLFGAPNVVKLLDVATHPQTSICVFVFEYVQNDDFRSLYPKLTNYDIQYYMYELLRTLDFVHSMGIFHRDVKPQNIMIDHSKRKLRLIDWGLGEYYHLEEEYNTRVASRYYKGPELLIGCRRYDYSLDIWSLGCVFAGLIFLKEPFFQGQDNVDQLDQIVKVLGTASLGKYLERLKLQLPAAVAPHIKPSEGKKWESFIHSKNQHRATPQAIDLLKRMLVIDHADRILASDAMKHPFFVDIRPPVSSSGTAAGSAPMASASLVGGATSPLFVGTSPATPSPGLTAIPKPGKVG